MLNAMFSKTCVFSRLSTLADLIPVLVTGIQASPSHWAEKTLSSRDARQLDACDKHEA